MNHIYVGVIVVNLFIRMYRVIYLTICIRKIGFTGFYLSHQWEHKNGHTLLLGQKCIHINKQSVKNFQLNYLKGSLTLGLLSRGQANRSLEAVVFTLLNM